MSNSVQSVPLLPPNSTRNGCLCCCCTCPCCSGKGEAACTLGAMGSLICTSLGSLASFTVGGGCSQVNVIGPIVLGIAGITLSTFPVLSSYGRLACKGNCSPSCSISWTVITGSASLIPIVLGATKAFAGCLQT